jgi:excisionase family DNA binding protein
MATLVREQPPLTEKDIKLALASKPYLANIIQSSQSLQVVVKSEQEKSIELPTLAIALLADILGAMAAGKRVYLIPENTELSTVEAADILNVSRPYLIKLLDTGKIPHRKVGRHRRILMEDLMAYKKERDAESAKLMDELVAEAQEYNMGY